MTMATNPATNQAQRCAASEGHSLNVHDPVLVAVCFFDGGDGHIARGKSLGERLEELATELDIGEEYTPRFSARDLSYLDVACYRWNPQTRATMVQFYVKPSQVWGVQFMLPVCPDPLPLEAALDAWRKVEGHLDDRIRDLIGSDLDDTRPGSNVYWGSSRLYWAILDETAATPQLAQEVQPIAGLDGPAQISTGEYGTLWRLDKPAVGEGPYWATWLLLSPQAQNDLVTSNYVLNIRFAVGEAYLCKARHLAGEYARLAQNLRGDVRSVRDKVQALLAKEAPSEFTSEQITPAQERLRQQQGDLSEVAAAYSSTLLLLPEMERLHWTVKINLGNYEKMAGEFRFWSHPAGQSEIEGLRRILSRIEHDQNGHRNLLQGLQTAIATVRADMELTGNRLAAARLDLEQEEAKRAKWQEQEEAKRAKRQETVIAIIGIVLGVSQIVVLTRQQFWWMVWISVPFSLALVLLLRLLRRS